MFIGSKVSQLVMKQVPGSFASYRSCSDDLLCLKDPVILEIIFNNNVYLRSFRGEKSNSGIKT